MKHSIRSSGWSRPFVVSSALLAIAACDQATPSDGGDELAVEDASKSDRPVACKARSDIDFTVVDGVAAGDGFAADSDVRKIIKTRATFEKYFGADAPDVDFAKDWVYVWAAPESAAGGTASIERLCKSTDGGALVVTTHLATPGDGCDEGDVRPQIVVSFPKPGSTVTSARATGDSEAGEACVETGAVCAKEHSGETDDGEVVAICDETFAARPFVRPPADVIDGANSKLTIAIDVARGFAFDRKGTYFELLDSRGKPLSLKEPSSAFPSLHLPSNRPMFMLYLVEGKVGTYTDPTWGKLDAITIKRIAPSIMLSADAIDKKFIGAWEGIVASRTSAGHYDMSKPLKIRLELTAAKAIDNIAEWGTPTETLPDGGRYKLTGVIANWSTSVKAADGTCLPSLTASAAKNPFFGGKNGNIDMYRLAAMHFSGDQVLVFTYPSGVSELSSNGMGGLGAFGMQDFLRVDAGDDSGLDIRPHATPNGHELKIAPVTGGGGGC